MFDLQEFAARYRLGLQDTASLVRAADDLLAEGHAEPAVIELSILESPIMAEAAPVFERACTQVGVTIPNKAEAIDVLLRQHVAAIATGAQPPHEGLQVIMREIYFPNIAGEPCKKQVGDSHGIEHLIGAYWGYDDLMERPQEVSFEGKYGGEAIACWEEFVRRQARDWLEKHTGPNVDRGDMLTAESDLEL